ncbi:MAG: hypothetical protein JSV89_15450, partial [Spirochaetaceae bacterium]
MKKIALGLLLLIPTLPLFAQAEEEDFDTLFEEEILEEEGEIEGGASGEDDGTGEDLFETDIFEDSVEQSEVAPEETFLVSEQLEWGGSFDLTFTTQVIWDDYPAPWEARFWQEGASTFSSRLAADLYFDARPERNFRVFGKVKTAYEYPADWEIEIFELFSDFQIRDLLFFRVGKQTIQWGVGYFFSPADVLNLVSIDPEDPEAEREGPIAVKAQLPFSAHNAYLYLVTNDMEEPSQIAVAPKLELLLGSYELGIGGFYQIDLTPKGILTLTGPLRDLDLFAEAMLQWGSDRTFVDFSPPPATYTIEGKLLFSGTAGFSYLKSDWNLSLFAQYFFNGQGYDSYNYQTLLIAANPLTGIVTAADILYP